MDCCTVNGLDKMFGPTFAKLDVWSYKRGGVSKFSRDIVDFFRSKGLARQSLLDVGCGAGTLLLELIKAGSAKGVGVDVSSAYIRAARELADKSQMGDHLQFAVMDFTERADSVDPADIVLMQRVVCCYPKMRELVIPAAEHARRFVALVYPRDVWWMQLGSSLLNLGLTLLRWEFRFYIHPPTEIVTTVIGQGFAQVFHRLSGPWHVVIFQRQFSG